MEFKPTRLYIKEHSVTGLKYFGKTTLNDERFRYYDGSGKYWLRHIKKHGIEHVKTIWLSEFFYNKDDVKEFAELFSEEFDIVNSKQWANMMLENGLDGGTFGNGDDNVAKRPDVRKKISEAAKSRKHPSPSNETRKKISEANSGKKRLDVSNYKKPKSSEHKAKIAKASLNRKRETCKYCGITCAINTLTRFHNDRCKAKV